MPNWCYNDVTVTGPKADRARFKSMLGGYSQWNNFRDKYALNDIRTSFINRKDMISFSNFLPTPWEVLAMGFNDAGYGWNNAIYGTKWDASECCVSDNKKELRISFNTAWGPPSGVYSQWCFLFPNLEFNIDLEVEGEGSDCCTPSPEDIDVKFRNTGHFKVIAKELIAYIMLGHKETPVYNYKVEYDSDDKKKKKTRKTFFGIDNDSGKYNIFDVMRHLNLKNNIFLLGRSSGRIPVIEVGKTVKSARIKEWR